MHYYTPSHAKPTLVFYFPAMLCVALLPSSHSGQHVLYHFLYFPLSFPHIFRAYFVLELCCTTAQSAGIELAIYHIFASFYYTSFHCS